MSKLGKMEAVELRDVWKSESGQFTPWLAEPENLALLADTLGLDLELVGREHAVGPFRADLVCQDTTSTDDAYVIIENQIEKTDHSHLGQLLTYAAAFDKTVAVVWIAERFTDEHRAALDWLNQITKEHVSFFGLEIELWRIGNSPVAPKFNMVCKPNDWVKESVAANAAGAGGVSETKALQQEYWRGLREFLKQKRSNLKPQAAGPKHWMVVSIGTSEFHISALVNTTESRIGVCLNITGQHAKKRFRLLQDERGVIESELGFSAEWRELLEKKSSRILYFKDIEDFSDRSRWSDHYVWMADVLERFYHVFKDRVRELSENDDFEAEE